MIEVEVKDKLFFAAEFDVKRDASTVMRVEALSVETNVPLSPVFVSCRKVFTDRNWCPPKEAAVQPKPETTEHAGFAEAVEVPACCDGPNLLPNGGFEAHGTPFGFETDYDLGGGAKAGAINVTPDASTVRAGWGACHTREDHFSQSTAARSQGLRRCGSSWKWNRKPTIVLPDGWPRSGGKKFQSHSSFVLPLPMARCNLSLSPRLQPYASGRSLRLPGTQVPLGPSPSKSFRCPYKSVGNDFGDFGIDDLWFCKSKKTECRARIMIRKYPFRAFRCDRRISAPARI